ncbi:phage integrase Arm DNA-binding domain-containing protein [Zobellella sp. DQSA1]|uniref:phage integrase Arm DNA-binding domain-containing protein n=1 Tax=Zobellella sp. DQSA1 TaxID=3342386 RepID=UPI0035C1D2D3
MARKRAHNISVSNLYRKLDKRNGKTYYQYRDPRTGVFHGLGTDSARAHAVATELNTLINKQLADQYSHLLELSPTARSARGVSVKRWCERYEQIQAERLKDGDLSANTLRSRKSCIKVIRERLGQLPLAQVDVKALAAIMDEYKEAGKKRMAQSLRSVWIDLFKEAQHAGEVPAGYNPALATKQPRVKVSRARLTLEQWRSMLQEAEQQGPAWLPIAMMLALVTGQRRDDIGGMKFTDIYDGYLHVVQGKTGVRLAIPLTLRCDVIGMTLADVVARCRSTGVVSKHLVHQTEKRKGARLGSHIHIDVITRQFARARDNSGITWADESSPPTFHEQRSLSERVYREQGLDTQTLLGHKDQRTTDKYHDNRGHEWLVIKA